MGRARDFGMGLGVGFGSLALAMVIAGSATADSRVPVASHLTLAAASAALSVLAPCPGDLNGDMVVNAADFAILASNYGNSCIGLDADQDGYTVAQGDCDDNNPNVNPGAPEVCNGIDDNCDSQVDEGFNFNTDTQNCGGCGLVCVNVPNTTSVVCNAGTCMIGACSPGFVDADLIYINGCETAIGDLDQDMDGYTPNQGDCLDTDPTINPGAPEICNSIDDNCDGQIDEGSPIGCTIFYRDADADGYGNPADFLCLCFPTPTYSATNGLDCNDTNPLINPGSPEICNNAIDDDCDGATDGADSECP